MIVGIKVCKTVPGGHLIRAAGPFLRRLITSALFIYGGCVSAQDTYPSKLIRIIVPFTAGSAPDVFARMLARSLESRIGQSVLIEARPGANSILGASLAAKAAPDGYTILYATSSATSAAKALFKSLPYDPINDLAALTIFQELYLVLLVKSDEKGLGFAQFLEKIRRNPASFSTAGASSTAEILDRMIDRATGKPEHVYIRYSNSSTMVNDLLGGRLGGAFHTVSGALPLIQSGQAFAIAVSSPVTLSRLPNVPTMKTTLPGVELGTWSGFFVPAKTPKVVINALYKPLALILKEPEFVRWSEESGRTLQMTPDEADAFVRAEEQRWTSLGRMAGIQPE